MLPIVTRNGNDAIKRGIITYYYYYYYLGCYNNST
jgi:hypothetical protein